MYKLLQHIIFPLIFLLVSLSVHASDTFTLGSGDTIKIIVYDEEDLSLQAQLGDSGTLNYPFLGELKIAGLTVAEVEQLVTKGLAGDYLIEPKVSVSVVQYRKFFINGEVNDPNAFSFQPGLTVSKAVSLAGGFTDRANKKVVSIISGDAQPREVGLGTAVQPGDVITVKESFF